MSNVHVSKLMIKKQHKDSVCMMKYSKLMNIMINSFRIILIMSMK